MAFSYSKPPSCSQNNILLLPYHVKGLNDDEVKRLVIKQLRMVSENDPWSQDKGFLLVGGNEGQGVMMVWGMMSNNGWSVVLHGA